MVPLHKYANCAFLLIRNKEEIHRKTTLSSTFLIRIRFRTNVNLSLQYLHGGSLKNYAYSPFKTKYGFLSKKQTYDLLFRLKWKTCWRSFVLSPAHRHLFSSFQILEIHPYCQREYIRRHY